MSVGGQSLAVMTENVAYGSATPRPGGHFLRETIEKGDQNNKEESCAALKVLLRYCSKMLSYPIQMISPGMVDVHRLSNITRILYIKMYLRASGSSSYPKRVFLCLHVACNQWEALPNDLCDFSFCSLENVYLR